MSFKISSSTQTLVLTEQQFQNLRELVDTAIYAKKESLKSFALDIDSLRAEEGVTSSVQRMSEEANESQYEIELDILLLDALNKMQSIR